MPINNSMNEQEIKEKAKPKPQKPDDRLEVAVFDHILIVDKQTGEKIVNKRG